MIHLACVVDDFEAADPAGSPAEAIVIPVGRDLACVGRVCESGRPRAELNDLVAHDRVLQGVMRSCTSLVPFRYGTVLADPAEVKAELAPRRRELIELLDRLRGRVELAVRAGQEAVGDRARSEGRAEGAGTAYLRSLAPLAEKSPLKRLHQTLAASAVAAVAEPDHGGGMKASYLVEEIESDAFVQVFHQAVAQTGGLGPVSVTGPWAPYTFAAMSGGSHD